MSDVVAGPGPGPGPGPAPAPAAPPPPAAPAPPPAADPAPAPPAALAPAPATPPPPPPGPPPVPPPAAPPPPPEQPPPPPAPAVAAAAPAAGAAPAPAPPALVVQPASSPILTAEILRQHAEALQKQEAAKEQTIRDAASPTTPSSAPHSQDDRSSTSSSDDTLSITRSDASPTHSTGHAIVSAPDRPPQNMAFVDASQDAGVDASMSPAERTQQARAAEERRAQRVNNYTKTPAELAQQSWFEWDLEHKQLKKSQNAPDSLIATTETHHGKQYDKFSYNGASILVTRGDDDIPKIKATGEADVLVEEALKAIKATSVKFKPPKNMELAKKYIEGFVSAGVTRLALPNTLNAEESESLTKFFHETLENKKSAQSVNRIEQAKAEAAAAKRDPHPSPAKSATSATPARPASPANPANSAPSTTS